MEELIKEIEEKKAGRKDETLLEELPLVTDHEIIKAMIQHDPDLKPQDTCVAMSYISPNGEGISSDILAINIHGTGSFEYLYGKIDQITKETLEDGVIWRIARTGWGGKPWPLSLFVLKLNVWSPIPPQIDESTTGAFMNAEVQKMYASQRAHDKKDDAVVQGIADSAKKSELEYLKKDKHLNME